MEDSCTWLHPLIMQIFKRAMDGAKRTWAKVRAGKVNRARLYYFLFLERPYMVAAFKKRIAHTSGLTQGSMITAYEQALIDILNKLATKKATTAPAAVAAKDLR